MGKTPILKFQSLFFNKCVENFENINKHKFKWVSLMFLLICDYPFLQCHLFHTVSAYSMSSAEGA